MRNKPIAGLLFCSLWAASMALHAGGFDQAGIGVRFLIELPLERVGGRTHGPSIGFALDHHVALDQPGAAFRSSGFASGFGRTVPGVDIAMLDVRIDLHKASLSRINILGTDAMPTRARFNADGEPQAQPQEQSTVGKGDVMAGLILLGTVAFVHDQLKKSTDAGTRKIEEITAK